MTAVAVKSPQVVSSTTLLVPEVVSGSRLGPSPTDSFASDATHDASVRDVSQSRAADSLGRGVSSPLASSAKARERPPAIRERSLLTKRYRAAATDASARPPTHSSQTIPSVLQSPRSVTAERAPSASTPVIPDVHQSQLRSHLRKHPDSAATSRDGLRFKRPPNSSGHQRSASLGSAARSHAAAHFSLADFRLGKVLGAGGTATVIRAELQSAPGAISTKNASSARVGSDHEVPDLDEDVQNRVCFSNNSSEVALKVVQKKSLSRRALHYLTREIAIHRSVESHSNVVALHDVFEDGAAIYLVQEFLRGGDLYAALKRERIGVPEASALLIVEQILEALAFMHARGFAHRDIKPENIMFEERPSLGDGRVGTVKLIDFGLACARDPNAPVRDRTSTEKCGTVRYAAPEVVTDPSYIPEMADVWSVGVVFYSAIAHRNPYSGKTEKEVLAQIENGAPCFDDDEWRDVSSDTKNLIIEMLRRKPTDRPSAQRALRLVRSVLSRSRGWGGATTSCGRHPGVRSVDHGHACSIRRGDREICEFSGQIKGSSGKQEGGSGCEHRHSPNLFDGLRALFSGGVSGTC